MVACLKLGQPQGIAPTSQRSTIPLLSGLFGDGLNENIFRRFPLLWCFALLTDTIIEYPVQCSFYRKGRRKGRREITKFYLCAPCATFANLAVNTICTAYKNCAGQQWVFCYNPL